MSRIERVHAREVLDSRGRPTVEVELHSDDGALGRAIVPSGASTGQAEAIELRDGDVARYDGLGVRRAVEHVRTILGPAVTGLDPADQERVDRTLIELDATPQKRRLGANAILGVSLAAAHLAASAAREPLYAHFHRLYSQVAQRHGLAAAPPRLPLPMTNMISGGLHAGGNLEFQDFLLSPIGAADYPTGLEWIVRVYRRLGVLLADAGYEARLVGDEGGYGPRLPSNRAGLEFLDRAVQASGLLPGVDVVYNLDVAASHFYDTPTGMYRGSGTVPISSDAMIDLLAELIDSFPIASIEDGLAEEDWTGWQRLVQRLGGRTCLIGDDLLTTNPRRVQRAIDGHAATGLLVKVNQIGTLTETLETICLARSAGWRLIVSARSGETEDTTIADLAVGTAAEQIKIGSVVRSERLAKYNRLLRIAEELP